MRDAFLVSVANYDRDYERLEAIAYMSTLHESARQSGTSEGIKRAEEIHAFLLEVSNDPSQSPAVRDAAYQALRSP